jgi:ABC-type nitrate/sulfonate/bicarbonate transport system substrate-binding protein
MVAVEPYNSIAEADNIANTLIDFSTVDPLPVFMAATSEFVEKHPDTIVKYLKVWLEAADDFKNHPDKVAEVVYEFYTSKGYKMSKDTFKKAMATVEVNPGFPSDLQPSMEGHAKALLEANKIKKMTDWKTAMRPEFMEKARAMG